LRNFPIQYLIEADTKYENKKSRPDIPGGFSLESVKPVIYFFFFVFTGICFAMVSFVLGSEMVRTP